MPGLGRPRRRSPLPTSRATNGSLPSGPRLDQQGPRAPAVAVINAVGVRMRDDKDVDDRRPARQQVEHYASIPPTAAALPGAEVVRRQVWTKTTGERTDVRKTGGLENQQGNRRPPVSRVRRSLDRLQPSAQESVESRGASSPHLDAAQAHADTLIVANIKRGWVESGTAEGDGQ